MIDSTFINDYQLALVSQFLNDRSQKIHFWHVPWPQFVLAEHVDALVRVATGLLHNDIVAFHTKEYVDNFFNFGGAHVAQAEMDYESNTIVRNFNDERPQRTRLVVAPLGIDIHRWSLLASRGGGSEACLHANGRPIVLSVDRVDYTKGILPRLEAIDQFLEKYPVYRDRVQFVQIGIRSRQGLPAFDDYWQRCLDRVRRINEAWGTKTWTPIHWMEDAKPDYDLATLYRAASVMIVSPLRDGLNLTAKEFVACQNANNGVLALSEGAGVWTELGSQCVKVDPSDKDGFATAIARCLSMSETERRARNIMAKGVLHRNSLVTWWNSLQGELCRVEPLPIMGRSI